MSTKTKVDENFKCTCGGTSFRGTMTTNCSHYIDVDIDEGYVYIEYTLDFVKSYDDFELECRECGKPYSSDTLEIESFYV